MNSHALETSLETSRTARWARPLAVLIGLGGVLVCAYAALAVLSFQFGPTSDLTQRPILTALALLGVAFLGYVFAIHVALRIREGAWLLSAIVVLSVLMRAVSLFSWPILEIDIYRYVWDGTVVLEGISPYRYSPEQIRSTTMSASLPEDLRRLVKLRNENAARRTILSRVHYGELPTIYPPVSQAVFSVAVFMTPRGASVLTHLVVMKTVLVLFDLATVGVVLGLLRLARKHIGWSVAYAWCPLVIKETANSGHLDSLAVFLTILALYVALKPLVRDASTRGGRTRILAASFLLALAVGAKLYPIVLLPLFVLLWSRVRGWRWASVATVGFAVITAILLWPMLPAKPADSPLKTERAKPGQEAAGGDVPPLPVATAEVPSPNTSRVKPQDPSTGLKAFLRRWEMNDFLFLVVVENLVPQGDVEAGERAWFSFVPEDSKAILLSKTSKWLGVEKAQTPYLLARLIMGSVFVLLVVVLSWPVRSRSDPVAWLRVAFLTVAWLWLLSPTQNPWYWTWALPLVMFARCRTWLAMSGLVMVYYVRFWLAAHWPDESLLGTPYSGSRLFDYVVTWVEFGPWFCCLAVESSYRKVFERHEKRRGGSGHGRSTAACNNSNGRPPCRSVANSNQGPVRMYSAFVFKIGGLLLVVTGVVALAVQTPRLETLSNSEKREKLTALYQRYQEEFPSVKEISPEALRDLHASGEVVLVDGREREERAVSMIPEAIPLEQFSDEQSSYRRQPVVFYCTAGYRSAELARKYAAEGYDAYNLRKGILGWLYEEFPIVSEGAETTAVHVYGPKWNLAPDCYEAIW